MSINCIQVLRVNFKQTKTTLRATDMLANCGRALGALFTSNSTAVDFMFVYELFFTFRYYVPSTPSYDVTCAERDGSLGHQRMCATPNYEFRVPSLPAIPTWSCIKTSSGLKTLFQATGICSLSSKLGEFTLHMHFTQHIILFTDF